MKFKGIQPPERWNVPFDHEKSSDELDKTADRLLALEPFCNMDPTQFPPDFSLRGILRNDSRVLKYRKGQIIIRKGDYGNSAYFVLSGTVCVDVARQGEDLPPSQLGRQERKRRGIWNSLAQIITNSKVPEHRSFSAQEPQPLDPPGMFLQDFPTIIKIITDEVFFKLLPC